MTTQQFNSPTPPPLDESAMLAWIEGRLSKIEESNLVKQARPGTTDRIQQMQANRRALQSVRDERAPAELMDRVLAALERDALVGLSNGQEISDHPPISIAPLLKEKQGTSWSTRHAPALALAAGIALLLTGVAYWGSLLFKPGKAPQLAQNAPQPLTPAGAPDEHLLAKSDTPSKDEPTRAGASSEARAADDFQPAPTMSPGRMLALAREGRLVMRVQSHDLANLPEIAAIEHSKMERSWRLTSNVPEQVVAAITPKPQPFVGPVPEQPVTIAGTNERPSQPNTLAAPSAKGPIEPEDPASRVKAKFLIDLPNTEKALNQVKLVFADRLKAGVVFEELDEPVKLPQAQDPETLLWWTLPPAQWVEHVTVPVVVEAK
jgi:hypothetical protein